MADGQSARRSEAIVEDARNRGARAAKNQSAFRELNERLKALSEAFSLGIPVRDWICECANDTCTERVQMSAAEYEVVRQTGNRFFVAPSGEHLWPDIEQAIERNDRYWVVEKLGDAGRLAEAIDARSDEGPPPLST
jgi:hypothetical protein